MARSVNKPVATGSITTYTSGFIISILLTLFAYTLVVNKLIEGLGLTLTIMGLAVVQLVVQLTLFLHLGRESKPRWNLTAFAFMLIMLLVIVIGSLWIMQNLNYNMMMTPEQMNQYMLEQSNKGF